MSEIEGSCVRLDDRVCEVGGPCVRLEDRVLGWRTVC